MAFFSLLLLVVLPDVSAHGMMNSPLPRASQNMETSPSFPMFVGGKHSQCVGDACLWYQVGCYIGCPTCSCKNKQMYPTPMADAGCKNPIEPTLPHEARSWNIEGKSPMGDFTKYNPWRSPGNAPVQNPCGVASGFVAGWPGAEVPANFPAFSNGTELKPLKSEKTIWKAGSSVEVSWGIAANHGGGYQYRLCPLSERPTEECFQKMPLAFSKSETTIRYTDGSRKDFTIPAVDASTGVSPKGSTWRRNPVPACNCDLGFSCYSGKSNMTQPYEIDPDAPTKYSAHKCTTGLQYPRSWDDGYGDGGTCLYPVGTTKPCDPFHFNMVDLVTVPSVLGDYVLSWRWDCEQTSQVWTQCADIKIEA